MSRKRQNITLPADLILDKGIFANAKIVYAVLETFPKDKPKFNADSGALSVTATHAEIIERSGLSKHTIVKSLTKLEKTGWIRQERNQGSPNKYYFTEPNFSQNKR